MTAAAFDTHAAVKKLTAAGFSEQQAEAQTALLAEALSSGIAELATKADLAELKQELRVQEERTAGRFHLLYWMIGFNLALTVAVLWKLMH